MNIQGKKVLVTGGAGFIGSNLVDALAKQNCNVIVLDDFSAGLIDNLELAKRTGVVQIVPGSILDYPLLESLVRQVNVVFHLAVQCLRVCFNRPHYVHEVNATGTLNLLKAAHEATLASNRPGTPGHIERFVYVSSSEVYGTATSVPMRETHELCPTTVYGASKLAGELYTRAYHITWGLPVVIARPFNTYGFREHYEGTSGEVIPRFVVKILNGLPPVVFGNGEQTRDFTFVTDTVEGVLRAAAHDGFIGDAVNIACGQEVKIKDIAEQLLALLGREDLSIVWEKERPGDVIRHYADTNQLESKTSFKPAIDIHTGLKLYIDWFRSQYPDPTKLLQELTTFNWEPNNAEVLAQTTH
ncbi:MAG: GDP-mannose 4,6-dehydratase [Candidatus Melainabacteria bacterium]|nr:GDP-mannose 4,6-dehydratase [Candidatus Melainabacteria bacterium]